MELLKSMLNDLRPVIPMGFAVAFIVVLMVYVHRYYEKRIRAGTQKGLRRQVVMLALTFAGLLLVIEASPMSDAQKGHLLSFFGIVLSAGIALSSTTFLGNALAGVMMRITKNFRMGDFIRVEDHFGRVTERGLFHIEIQTEDRCLITLPNLYLVTNPVKVIRTSGTILSAEISLGYDVSRVKVERLLLEAARAADLADPFVHILDLGDFSVKYRVAGLLSEVKQFLSARSHLRETVLDSLHTGGIEIVSPNFMNTRAVSEDQRFIPRVTRVAEKTPDVVAEDVAFDKADEAESTEKLQQRNADTVKQIEDLQKELKKADSDEEREKIQSHIARLEKIQARLSALVKKRTDES